MELADFLQRWANTPARERAHAQQFFLERCEILDMPAPDLSQDGDRYAFERDVPLLRDDASNSPCRIDLFREGAVVLEFKQGSGGDLGGAPVAGPRGTARRGTAGWDVASSPTPPCAPGCGRPSSIPTPRTRPATPPASPARSPATSPTWPASWSAPDTRRGSPPGS